MLWTFGQFGYQDQFLMDMMHEIAQKLQADCNSKALADVMYAMARMGWADPRLHTLVAEYAMDNIQVCEFGYVLRFRLFLVIQDMGIGLTGNEHMPLCLAEHSYISRGCSSWQLTATTFGL